MLNKGLRSLFLFLVVLLLISATTPLALHSLHAEVWLWIVAAIAGILLLGRTRHGWRLRTTLLVLIILIPISSLFKLLLVWRGDWMTQGIIYEHRTIPGRTIEFQMMNPGPGSYRRRTVDRQRLLPGLEWLRKPHLDKIDTTEWKRVDKEINELGLKYA
jgi:hypothetical protein